MDIHAAVMHQLMMWIEANIEQKLMLETVARRAGYSQWHLQRLFRSYTGVALGAYIRERKLTASVITLLSSNTSLMQIALQFGFDSQQTYCRTFRRMFDLPPGAFRRKYRHSLPPIDGPASLLMLHSQSRLAS
ncbi:MULTISPECIES: helix-turn-helix domain-containing protein [unclassified Pantoea]|uniref:helix-turn-helix domain-containing protein n=1 Tax=unclassified Pantoea TaxID=2630326 RepID=UPI000CE353B5|nr:MULTISPECIES: helix-turn-helix domain-containing protein [unclassified Pantoea]MBK4769177.1 helix-turn-helix domain-containing protein [Pantoea sp. Morm]MDI6955209.1 helix-turn-helix domain-containing protein [Pantoea sp. Pa-EAmG]NIG36253.1 helix-turn-helix domain-containing protein [Pantoea sp. Ap-959]PPC65503.1 AraC family transcriptional regulator [Pantoea sp. ICBG 828]